ncbi:MAG: hypothetical protein ACQEWM_03160 [Actinomycetota bacterium]
MRSPARLLAPLALVVTAAALAACSGAPAPDPQPTIPPGITAPPPTMPASPTPEVESSLPAEIAGVDTSGWQQIAVPSGGATFRIPPEWTVAEAADGLDVVRDDGQRQLGYVEDVPEGDGRCVDGEGTPVAWRTAILDRQEVSLEGAPGVAYGAAALQLGEQWIVSVGLRPAADVQSPACPIVNVVTTPNGAISFGSEVNVTGSGDGAPWAVASAAAAEAYVATPEYATIRAILMSLELQGPPAP